MDLFASIFFVIGPNILLSYYCPYQAWTIMITVILNHTSTNYFYFITDFLIICDIWWIFCYFKCMFMFQILFNFKLINWIIFKHSVIYWFIPFYHCFKVAHCTCSETETKCHMMAILIFCEIVGIDWFGQISS